ncbi:LTD domain-containing protein [Trichostrongylus colubriformis]|uniref:LTD domain-containing protein n=1 Tax=Trichostrongylus colubriformis TaxID=6319 RepID=A0AAN8F3Q7_TRICO
MLEGEESRVGLRQMVEQVVKTHSLQQQEDTDSTRSVRGEVSTKTTFQRSAKGNVTIAECDPNGKFITLENTHRTKDENLGEHKLKRKLDKGLLKGKDEWSPSQLSSFITDPKSLIASLVAFAQP